MPNCCQGATCACKVVAAPGGHMTVTGSGQAQDPFLLAADVAFGVASNTTFNMTQSGSGTADDPWVISVDYAATARLTDLPDVDAPAPGNGQVLGWNASTGQWEAQAPTTASAGTILHNQSLQGDGSAASPLGVVPDANRLIQSSTQGIGLSDNGMASVVRHFANVTDRAAGTPAPTLNSLSILDNVPGRIDYWNGTVWTPLLDRISVTATSTFLQISGPYNSTTPLNRILGQVSATTDANGNFTVLSSADLATAAGVVSVHVQETGTAAVRVLVNPVSGQVQGTAYRLTDGQLATNTPVTVLVDAMLY